MIQIGNRLIGDAQACFLVAEIGINHNGDLDLARQMIDAAGEAGADAVKFQSYLTEDFVTDRSLTYQYVSQGQTIIESQYEMFKRCELKTEELAFLKNYCEQRGLLFFSTPTSEDGVAELARIGTPLLKNGSDYLIHLPLVRAMARTQLPTILSTGMATLGDIDDAVRAFREAGGKDLILLHCTSSYPTPAEDVHLRKIPALKAAFGCPIGFSDHTWGIVAAIGAVARGACMIEKHFTLDKEMRGPDHRFSADAVEFKALVDAVRTLEKNLGSSVIGLTPSELKGRNDFRLSCVANRALPANHLLTESDIGFRRPGNGLLPKQSTMLLGRRLKRGIPAGEQLGLEDLQ